MKAMPGIREMETGRQGDRENVPTRLGGSKMTSGTYENTDEMKPETIREQR